jgi:hypothetical protein
LQTTRNSSTSAPEGQLSLTVVVVLAPEFTDAKFRALDFRWGFAVTYLNLIVLIPLSALPENSDHALGRFVESLTFAAPCRVGISSGGRRLGWRS